MKHPSNELFLNLVLADDISNSPDSLRIFLEWQIADSGSTGDAHHLLEYTLFFWLMQPLFQSYFSAFLKIT
ncbi:MAG: hypothetical protein ONB16_03415 [candidate division KSB1 bacterium]|nr:hypothetical protein [candidate division KSB1 bacterium]MDZ7341575.1 hypothetical protein [candidate division KSB1 bacterium]